MTSHNCTAAVSKLSWKRPTVVSFVYNYSKRRKEQVSQLMGNNDQDTHQLLFTKEGKCTPLNL